MTADPAGDQRLIGDYVALLRPSQWIKNLAVFAGPAFGLTLLDGLSLARAALVFAAFCLASSASYAINDTLDREADALHPTKRNRPIARGAIQPGSAVVFAVLLIGVAVGLSGVLLPLLATLTLVAHFVMILAYSLVLKRRVILDVIIIATGFVLRALAGAAAVEVYISPWLVIGTFTVCMFLGFGKRRCEIAVLSNAKEAGEHRSTLLRYTPELLTHLIAVTAGITIMTFILYTMDSAHQPPFPKEHLLYTLPLVVYGVFRYAMLTASGDSHGPTDILLSDRPLQGTVVLWALIAFGVIYEQQLRTWTGL